MKRVDQEEIDSYKASGKSLVPLPSPRPEEASELYIALEKWEDAPAFMERTVIEPNPAKTQGSPGNSPGEITVPEREFLSNSRHDGEAEERIFLSRLRLRGPVSPQLHAGKYVVMTMSRSNLKAIDYAVAYVHIVPSKFNFNMFGYNKLKVFGLIQLRNSELSQLILRSINFIVIEAVTL